MTQQKTSAAQATEAIQSNAADSTPHSRRGVFILIEGLDRAGKSTQCKMLHEVLAKQSIEQSIQPQQQQSIDSSSQQSNNAHSMESATSTQISNNDNDNDDKSNCLLLRFPDRTTPIGQMINEYLAQKPVCASASNESTLTQQQQEPKPKPDLHSMHLLFSANRWEWQSIMKQTLQPQATAASAAESVASQLQPQLLAQPRHIVCDRYSPSGCAYTNASSKGELSLEWCQASDRGLIAPDLVLYLSLSEQVQLARGGFGEERYETSEIQRGVRRAFETMLREANEQEQKQQQSSESVGTQWIQIEASQSIEQVHRDCVRHALAAIQRIHKSNAPLHHIQ